MFRRPRKRRCYTLEERIQKFESKALPRKAPENAVDATKRQALARGPLPDSSPCSRLMTVILNNLTKGQDGNWYFLCAIRLAADLSGMDPKQARRCMRRFKENGILEEYGKVRRCTPKQYLIHLKTKA